MGFERRFAAVLNEAPNRQLSRRAVLKRAAAFGLATPAVMALLAACGGDDAASETPEGSGGASGESTATAASTSSSTAEAGSATPPNQGIPGGTFTAAYFEEPPTMDVHLVTSRETAFVGWHVYESLFTWSDSYEVLPMLAESHEISDDGLLHTLTIRQGVPFHNGQELTAADVIASIQRWGTKNGVGKEMLALVEEITAVDDSTIEFQFAEPYSIFAGALGLSYQGCAIYPESVVTAAGEDDISEYIGTGPYQFVSWDRGQSIRLERFDDYAALEGEPNGYGGHKYAYLDAIEFVPVSDEAARIAGVRAGDYDYVERFGGDQVPTLEGDDNVVVAVVKARGFDNLLLNTESPVIGDLKVRQAMQAALDCGPILEAGRGSGFYELYPSLMPEETIWYTEAGGELYNQGDPEKARQLLRESSYDGTPLRLLTTQADLSKYQPSVVIKQQLEAVGFTVDLQIYDWSTAMERFRQQDLWEGIVTNTSFRPDPALENIAQLCTVLTGWLCSAELQAALDRLLSEPDTEARFEAWEQYQSRVFEEVPTVYLGQASDLFAYRKGVQGLTSQGQMGTILWNAWLQE